MPENDAVANLATVQDTLTKALKEAGRSTNAVTVTAVTKKFEAKTILPLLKAGHRVFGENRVQEAAGKWPELQKTFEDISLHLIGPLQSNKVKDAVALFDVIETLDRPKLAKALSTEMQKTGKAPKLLIQINTGDEDQKAGVLPAEADAFIQMCQKEYSLDIEGLMCIPPIDENPATHFALLEKMAREHGLKTISMGMSGDYEMAVQLGATHVRVGSGIFGARPSS